MVDYSSYVVMRPVGSALCGKDKGDISNRMQCAGEQGLNTAKAVGKSALTLGVAAGASYGIYKSSKVATFGAKIFNKLGKSAYNLLGKLGHSSFIDKVAKTINKLPPVAKAIGLVAIPAAIVLGHINNKYLYQAGQIDQKYSDKAQMENRLKQVMA